MLFFKKSIINFLFFIAFCSSSIGEQIRLKEVASGYRRITDIQFIPGQKNTALILTQMGGIYWQSFSKKEKGEIFQIPVQHYSELGLLGLAFHPNFKKNRKIYLNYTPSLRDQPITRVSEWILPRPKGKKWSPPKKERILLEVIQPFSNHNAGQLAFGPDGYLYIGLGDGGSGGDPHGHGQNTRTFLGSMLRIDVDRKDKGKPYSVPKDNPFVKNAKYRPEIWAIGLRNPWKYSFTRDGRLVVADVGQNAVEEVSIITRGSNLGWKIMEGNLCYPSGKKCKIKGMVEPVFQYGRAEGISITGGFVYYGKKIGSLAGRYVFGDFGSGQIWALNLKTKRSQALGKFDAAISTFGQNSEGEIFLGDYRSGKIFSIEPKN